MVGSVCIREHIPSPERNCRFGRELYAFVGFSNYMTLSGPNGAEIVTALGNQLTDGSMIDVCGVTLLFQGPVHMAAASHVSVQWPYSYSI